MNAKEEYIDAGGFSLWTCTQGRGKPVLMLHGGPGMCDYLGPVAEMIDHICTVYRYEQRGCGRSGKTDRNDLKANLADIETLRRHFEIDRWVVVGHSWGGCLALAYALEHQERVTGMIQISSTGITVDWKDEYHRKRDEMGEVFPDLPYTTNLDINRQLNKEWERFIRLPGLEENIQNLDIPALFIHSENDIRPSYPTKHLARLFKNSVYKEIPGADHFPWLKSYEQLGKILRDFLNGGI